MKYFYIKIEDNEKILLLIELINNINAKLENKNLVFKILINKKDEAIKLIDFLINAYQIKKNQIGKINIKKCQIEVQYEYNLIMVVKIIVDFLNNESPYLKELDIKSNEKFNQIIVNDLEDDACIIKNNQIYYCNIINSNYYIEKILEDNQLIKSYKLYIELKNKAF